MRALRLPIASLFGVALVLNALACAQGGDGEISAGRDAGLADAGRADTGRGDTGRADTGSLPVPDAAMRDVGCVGAGACTPGASETGGACGCGGSEVRTCAADCAWGEWACSSAGTGTECTAGMTDSETVPCGRCNSGTMTRTRSCDPDSCTWGAFVDGACVGERGCVPGARVPGCDMGATGSPTSCGEQVCTSSCTLGACQPVAGAQCLSGGGSSFQCCTPSGGGPGWQFCSPSTCQWFPCAAHSCT